MRTVYNVLEQGGGQVGILESPTGTVRPLLICSMVFSCMLMLPQGKSLSLICAAMTWLRNHKKKTLEVSIDTAAESYRDEPDWVVEQLLKRKRAEIVDLWEEREEKLRNVRAREAMMEKQGKKRKRYDEGSGIDKKAKDHGAEGDDDDEEWLLDEQEDQDIPKFASMNKEEDDEINGPDQVKVVHDVLCTALYS